VELSAAAGRDLEYLCALERLNKTTVVNRAIHVYALLRKAETSGGQVLMSEGADEPLQRVRFI
jgi:hypothetical protein